MRVLVIGHACSPYAGSEPGLTWNWAWHLAEEHEVGLIAHPHFRGGVEDYLETTPNPRLAFHWASVPRALDPWDPVQGERGLRLHYLLWLRSAYRLAEKIVAEARIDIVHHVSLGTLSAPPPFWRLRVPFIWGPLGGGQIAPSAFRRYFGTDWQHERRRAWRIRLAAAGPLRRAARHAACVLATNHETAGLLRRAGAADVRLWSDNGVKSVCEKESRRLGTAEAMTVLWAGRHESRKGLPLLLEAVARLRGLPLRVMVAGDGPKRAEWQALSHALGLGGMVEFLGRVPPAQMLSLFAAADAIAFTSLQDSLGSVTLDALASGLPLISLNHQGQRAIIPDDAAIKVPVTAPEATIAALAGAILDLLKSPERRAELSRRGIGFARSLLWRERTQAIARIYAEKLSPEESRCPISASASSCPATIWSDGSTTPLPPS